MNSLMPDRQAAVVRALVEGNSLRATARMMGVARETVAKLLRDLGAHCKNLHDRRVMNVNAKRIQADEIWSFNFCKEKNVAPDERGQGKGDIWTWVALDPDSKLVIAYRVGSRNTANALPFMHDLADRLTGRVQMTTDAFHPYLDAVESAFGADVDYARLVKVFGLTNARDAARRYSPAHLVHTSHEIITGNPEVAKISTSHVERQNLTMRMTDAPLHPPDQRVLKEGRVPPVRGRPSLRALQLVPCPYDAQSGRREADHPGNGRWPRNQRVDD